MDYAYIHTQTGNSNLRPTLGFDSKSPCKRYLANFILAIVFTTSADEAHAPGFRSSLKTEVK